MLDAVHAVVAVFTAVPPRAAVVVHVLAAVSHIACRVLALGALENPLLACRETVRAKDQHIAQYSSHSITCFN